jgi:hypothetical protein
VSRPRFVHPGAIVLTLCLSAAAPAQDTHLIVVAGLGGGEAYDASFHEWSSRLIDAAEKKLGVPRAQLAYLGGRAAQEPGRGDGPATRDTVAAAIAAAGARARAGDTITIVLFGHGSGSGEDARFNLQGPDATARDFAAWLAPLGGRNVVFVNAASASGDFQKVLAAKNRVIVTATRSSMERNEALFGGFFAAALAGDAADADKNGRVSILEAFEAAKAQVAQEYQKTRRLLTEHATLEDGSGGALARRVFLAGSASPADAGAESGTSSPEVARLRGELRALEEKVEALKAQKEAGRIAGQEYETRLEALLLELSLKGEELRKALGGGS